MNQNGEQDTHHAQTSPSSLASTPNGQVNPPRALKDRHCPFCDQPFTTSSLGRHLDLYIRPHNPKPPDNVHDLDEIRKLRGNVTRRQRASSARHTDARRASGPPGDNIRWAANERASRANQTPAVYGPVQSSPVSAAPESLDASPSGPATEMINDPTHHVGARSHIDTTSTAISTTNGRPCPSRGDAGQDGASHHSQWVPDESQGSERIQETIETGKAAELALRQLCQSLQAAKHNAATRQPFEGVEFDQLSFAGMCLVLLSPPSALFTTTPFATQESWSLQPPGRQQFDSLAGVLEARVSATRHDGESFFPPAAAVKYRDLLSAAWEQWQLTSEAEKATAWSLELCRAFVKVKTEVQQLGGKLEAANQRIKHLEAEHEYLSRHRDPFGQRHGPPDTIEVPMNVMRSMRSDLPASNANYDADSLIDQWREPVKWSRDTEAHHLGKKAQKPGRFTDKRTSHRADTRKQGLAFSNAGAMDEAFDSSIQQTPALPQEPPREIRNHVGNSVETDLNHDGKRPLRTASLNGRSDGPKSYRWKQWKGL